MSLHTYVTLRFVTYITLELSTFKKQLQRKHTALLAYVCTNEFTYLMIKGFVEHFTINISDIKIERFDKSMSSLSSSKYMIELIFYRNCK